MRLETVGKNLERNWKGLENLHCVDGAGGVGSNARKREKCQAGQCLIRVDGNWNEIGNSWKEIGKDWRICGAVVGRQ